MGHNEGPCGGQDGKPRPGRAPRELCYQLSVTGNQRCSQNQARPLQQSSHASERSCPTLPGEQIPAGPGARLTCPQLALRMAVSVSFCSLTHGHLGGSRGGR